MVIRLPAAVLIVIVVAVTGAACARPTTSSPVLSTVPITDFKSVAGKWGGLVRGLPPRGSGRDEDFVDVEIRPDGTYDFGIFRTVGVFGGKGQLTIDDGRLTFKTERGATTVVLLEGNGKRILRANAVMTNGLRLSSDLTPVR
ncbi:MAG: hypothetical protein ACREKS_21780 [Candidatus Rokuibacteriota bacterium]